MGSLDLTSLVLETWTPKGAGAHRGHPGRKPSPEQVMQEMPSALKLYLRSSSTWMLVSGRKSSGARLAGRSRLANTRDRMRMETKRPARKGCCARQGWGRGWGHAQPGLPEPGERAAPSMGTGGGKGGRYPKGAGKGPACQPVREAARGPSLGGRGRLSHVSLVVRL